MYYAAFYFEACQNLRSLAISDVLQNISEVLFN